MSMQAIIAACQSGANLYDFVRATTKTRNDALEHAQALGQIVDGLQALGYRFTVTNHPEWQSLLDLQGAARFLYIKHLPDDQLGHAVGALATAVSDVNLATRIKFSDAPPAPKQGPIPIPVAIVSQPTTTATSTVKRDATGAIVATEIVTVSEREQPDGDEAAA